MSEIHPELASKYDKQNVRDWWMSEKLDGVRAWWCNGKLYSREGNMFYSPPYFTEKFPDITLDGELFMGKGRFQDCVGTVKRHQPTEAWKELQFVVFDAPHIESSFENRLTKVREKIAEIEDCTYIRLLEQVKCTGSESVQTFLSQIESEGGEGVMLRHPTALYNPYGKRTSNLLKVKTMHDAEAVVIGHEAGKGKHLGRLGALLCTVKEDPTKKFKIGTGFTDEERMNPPEIGSTVTYRYFELTKGGIPRFPAYMRVRKDY